MYNRVVEHRLNKGLRPMELPKIDSKVKIYVAPGQKELKRRKRRRAHTLVWKGPATVTKQISETEFETEYRGRKFERNLKSLSPGNPGTVIGDSKALTIYTQVQARRSPNTPLVLIEAMASRDRQGY